MSIDFDRYAQEGNEFMNKLAADLGHPTEVGRTGMILRAVLHTLRDRISIAESFDFMSQLPVSLKVVYVEDWKYHDKPPVRASSIEEFCRHVEEEQRKYGESRFDWKKSTREIVEIVLDHVTANVSDGQKKHILDQLPEKLQPLLK